MFSASVERLLTASAPYAEWSCELRERCEQAESVADADGRRTLQGQWQLPCCVLLSRRVLLKDERRKQCRGLCRRQRREKVIEDHLGEDERICSVDAARDATLEVDDVGIGVVLMKETALSACVLRREGDTHREREREREREGEKWMRCPVKDQHSNPNPNPNPNTQP